MNGQALYTHFAYIQAEVNNCSIDPWDIIGESEQTAWNMLAELVAIS